MLRNRDEMSTIERLTKLDAEATPGPWVWEWNKSRLLHAYLQGKTGRVLDDGSAGGEYCQEIDPEGPDALLIAEMRNVLPKLLTALRNADTLAIHVSGILALKAVGTPETTKGWLDEYIKARAALDENSVT